MLYCMIWHVDGQNTPFWRSEGDLYGKALCFENKEVEYGFLRNRDRDEIGEITTLIWVENPWF